MFRRPTPPKEPFEDFSPEEIDDFIYSGKLTPAQQQLMAAFREALDAALLFLSLHDLGGLEALMPKVVRGSKDAALNARQLLISAMKAAHRDRDEGFFLRLLRRARRRKLPRLCASGSLMGKHRTSDTP